MKSRRLRILGPAVFVTAYLLNGILLWLGVYGLKMGNDVFQAGAEFYAIFFILPLVFTLPIGALFDFVTKRLHLLEAPATIDPATAPLRELIGWLGITVVS